MRPTVGCAERTTDQMDRGTRPEHPGAGTARTHPFLEEAPPCRPKPQKKAPRPHTHRTGPVGSLLGHETTRGTTGRKDTANTETTDLARVRLGTPARRTRSPGSSRPVRIVGVPRDFFPPVRRFVRRGWVWRTNRRRRCCCRICFWIGRSITTVRAERTTSCFRLSDASASGRPRQRHRRSRMLSVCLQRVARCCFWCCSVAPFRDSGPGRESRSESLGFNELIYENVLLLWVHTLQRLSQFTKTRFDAFLARQGSGYG